MILEEQTIWQTKGPIPRHVGRGSPGWKPRLQDARMKETGIRGLALEAKSKEQIQQGGGHSLHLNEELYESQRRGVRL